MKGWILKIIIFTKLSMYRYINIVDCGIKKLVQECINTHHTAASLGSFRKCRFMDVIYGYKYDFVVMLKKFIIALTFRNHYYLKVLLILQFIFQVKN